MLSQDAARRALLHLTTMGDTDIFPAPFEFVFYAERPVEISDAISKMDTAQYEPRGCIEVLSPKGSLSFRIAHQLYPADTLLYTTAVIEIATQIEGLRQPVDNGPFSYRYLDEADNPRLFAESSSYHDWLTHLQLLFDETKPFADAKHVIETDISDFYSRIYFHRIEHVLDDCNASNAVRKIIEGIIKFSRGRQSYGLPVGTAASRMLAEGLLNDTDIMIAERAVGYSRYVDDFRIVVSSQLEVHSTLCAIASHLMLTEGLSLNASKTRIGNNASALALVNDKLSDVFNDDEILNASRYIRQVYEDEDVSVEDIHEIDEDKLTEKLRDILSRDVVDYGTVKVILKAFRAAGHSNPPIFIDNFGTLLYYVPRDFCLLLGALAQRSPDHADELADKLVALSATTPFSEMVLSKVWVSHLFTAQALQITRQRLAVLKLGESAAEKRQFLLLKGLLKDRAYFRGRKTSFNEASDWEKGALLYGASCMSKSEYTTWLDTIKRHYRDPFATLYLKWLGSNRDSLFEKLKQDFKVQNRSEAAIEKFAKLFGPIDDDDDLPI